MKTKLISLISIIAALSAVPVSADDAELDITEQYSSCEVLMMRFIADEAGQGGMDLTTYGPCLLYTSPSPRDGLLSRMPSSA